MSLLTDGINTFLLEITFVNVETESNCVTMVWYMYIYNGSETMWKQETLLKLHLELQKLLRHAKQIRKQRS